MALAKAYVFDAYGTLFDVHSAVAHHRDAIGPKADAISDLWRTKQLEYTWTRTLMGAWLDFRALTAMALDFAAAKHGGLPAGLRENLLAAYETLDAFADVAPTLAALKAAGVKTAILSNGTRDMLANAVSSAGIGQWLDASLSIDEIRAFKTTPAAYELVGRHLGVALVAGWIQRAAMRCARIRSLTRHSRARPICQVAVFRVFASSCHELEKLRARQVDVHRLCRIRAREHAAVKALLAVDPDLKR